jgi:uncharacterized membrane protein
VQGLDPGTTAQLARREDPSTAVADLVVVGAGTAMLTAVGFALVKAAHAAGGIDFNEDEPPNYIDFGYYSFVIGMTFQVADTNVTSRAIRRATLHHALLSYLFGSVLLGLVINVVATLLQ